MTATAMKIRNQLLFVVAVVLSCSLTGCISSTMAHYAGKYRTLLAKSSTREKFQARLGKPVESYVKGSHKPHTYALSGAYAYDVFRVRGIVHRPGDGAAQSTISAVTLGGGEIVLVPLTVAGIVSAQGDRHTLVVFYDASFHYTSHDLYDQKGEKEDTFGY